MNAYVDTSVLLRKLLREPEPLEGFSRVDLYVSSELLRVEALRTLDRMRLRGLLDDEEMAERSSVLLSALESIELVEITPQILRRAEQSFPTSLGTLEAIHLASAVLWRDHTGNDLTLFTHDRELALAARALGFSTAGEG